MKQGLHSLIDSKLWSQKDHTSKLKQIAEAHYCVGFNELHPAQQAEVSYSAFLQESIDVYRALCTFTQVSLDRIMAHILVERDYFSENGREAQLYGSAFCQVYKNRAFLDAKKELSLN